jgi:hypothetical protein
MSCLNQQFHDYFILIRHYKENYGYNDSISKRCAPTVYFSVQVNSHSVYFTNCDDNPSSYIALFPNVFDASKVKHISVDLPMNQQVIGHLAAASPLIPTNYFMLMEMGFGGCGCLIVTDGGSIVSYMTGAAMGFR